MVYEGTGIWNGSEGYALIEEAEIILSENNIPLPDYHKVEFIIFSRNEFIGK